MEKDKFFGNEGQGNGIPPAWHPIFGMELQANDPNGAPQHFLNPNWDTPMDQSDPFESALSSIVSSPVNSNPNPNPGIAIPASESVVLRELIGRLGSICNSGEVSNGNNSANTSCYNTPLSSPPKLNLSTMETHGNWPILPRNHQFQAPFCADPGFADRAARFSSFGGKNCEVAARKMGVKAGEDGVDQKVNRVVVGLTQESKALENSMEVSSVSEQIPGGQTGVKGQSCSPNGRKRKGVPKGKGKETPSSSAVKEVKVVGEAEKEELDAKRQKSKSNEDGIANSKELGEGNGNQKQTKENAKPAEPPKDYIHVRARRGQATDSHSLAERVRREKISERMKFLQDLVPGCNKVTGKAVMLDEIINYVQSLQRQVEFLSMKLATVNPRMDVGMDSPLSKDMFQPSSLDASTHSFPYGFQSSQPNGMILGGAENPSSMNNLMAFMHHNSSMKPSHTNDFGEASAFWESDLQSVVQMGFGQTQPPSFHGTMGTSQMKVEL